MFPFLRKNKYGQWISRSGRTVKDGDWVEILAGGIYQPVRIRYNKTIDSFYFFVGGRAYDLEFIDFRYPPPNIDSLEFKNEIAKEEQRITQLNIDKKTKSKLIANIMWAMSEKQIGERAILTYKNFNEMIFKGIVFSEADLSFSDFSDSTFEDVNFKHADIEAAIFKKTIFHKGDLSLLKGWDAIFTEAKMEETDFNRARMDEAHFEKAQLDGCNFGFACIKGVSFLNTKINNTEFETAEINFSNFEQSELIGTGFRGVSAYHTSFKNSKLIDVSFIGAYLEGADFSGAVLTRVDFKNATFKDTIISDEQRTGNSSG